MDKEPLGKGHPVPRESLLPNAARAEQDADEREVDAPPLSPLPRLEHKLLLPRICVGVAVGATSLFVPGAWAWGLLPAGLYFIAVSAVAHHQLSTSSPRRMHLLWTSVADALGCVAVFALLLPAPEAPAVLLLPLLAFELSLKHCLRGAAVVIGILTLGIGAKVLYRSNIAGLPPRLWLILLIFAVTGLLLGLAGMLRTVDRSRLEAVKDRQRLAELLRSTVITVLDEAGHHTAGKERDELLTLTEQACAQPLLGAEITRRLVAAVAPRGNRSPLSARENEILALIAAGRSDRDIAGELFLSRGTIRVHVSNIVHKLGVQDRRQAVEWYRRQS